MESHLLTRQSAPRVVVVAMKPQLRGRIRRNVETLLSMGAHVVVVTVDGGRDFFVGLHHPRLAVRFVQPKSPLERFNGWIFRLNDRRLQLWEARRRSSGRLSVRREEPEPERAAGGTGVGRESISVALVRRARSARRATINGYRQARRRAIRFVQTRLRPWHRMGRWVDFWRLSYAAVKEMAPDVVASSDLPGLVGANMAARRLGKPHLHDCHELYLESTHLRRIERLLLWPVERRFMRRASVVVCVNESIADEYARRYAVAPLVVRNCAPRPTIVRGASLRALAGLDAGNRIVLYQGGFAEGRGLDVLIDAVRYFADGWHLVMLGDGTYVAELRRMVEGLGENAARVHFIDAVPPDALLSLTRTADVGVVPYQPVSLNNRLALPNKVFEYTGAGVPIVASDVPELRRVVATGKCGAVYDPYSARSLATSVAGVLENPEYDELRMNARRFGENNCWENERVILQSAYRHVSEGLRGQRLQSAQQTPFDAVVSQRTGSRPPTRWPRIEHCVEAELDDPRRLTELAVGRSFLHDVAAR